VCARLAYLNAGTFGPLPRRSGEAVAGWTRRLVEEGRSSKALFDELLALRARVRAEIGALLNAPEGSIALTTATTDGCNIVLTGLGIGPGDEVVTTDSEHPGLFGGLLASGATLRIADIRTRPAGEALALLEEQLTDRTRLVALSHVSWLTGAVLPIRELAERHDIPLLVDGAQGAGAIPVDVRELGCDFYTVSAQKWLLGPEATGALFVRPERVGELRLTFPSYLSWQFPGYEPRPDAARFDPGWIPAGSLAGLVESLAFANDAGADRFRHAREMAERCRELLAARGPVVTEPGQATLISWPADEPEVVAEKLAEAGVVVRDLPGTGWVRASCGFWTSEEDLERLIRAM
jgi:L-cysteine/cystine lyase